MSQYFQVILAKPVWTTMWTILILRLPLNACCQFNWTPQFSIDCQIAGAWRHVVIYGNRSRSSKATDTLVEKNVNVIVNFTWTSAFVSNGAFVIIQERRFQLILTTLLMLLSISVNVASNSTFPRASIAHDWSKYRGQMKRFRINIKLNFTSVCQLRLTTNSLKVPIQSLRSTAIEMCANKCVRSI